ncbi:MAG: hypothetical protein P8O79_14230 [Halieaceae bacterium]|nr:hypothetical protein [Halieaceae bacterium]
MGVKVLFGARIRFFLSILLFLPLFAHAGEFFCAKDSDEVCLIAKFAGPILPDDHEKLTVFLKSNPGIYYLLLDSNGGDIQASLAIGQIVRKSGLLTFIDEGDTCNSACFFVWFAGIYRSGDPGIHRPYKPGAGLANAKLEEAESLYTALQTAINR